LIVVPPRKSPADEKRMKALPLRRVLSCGTFDHFHPGHDAFLSQARRLGEELFVVVSRDENVLRLKGRTPDQVEDVRLAVVADHGCVDDARLGYPGADFLRVVADIRPHVIALGYDQRAPRGLETAFPDCEIVTLAPFEPDRFKSSLLREGGT